MPIFRTNGKIFHFAHVPKCGGVSVERYLEIRFGPLSFLCGGWWRLPDSARWGTSSPQHIRAEDLRRLFAEDFFDHRFALVRHPLRRLISAYVYNRNLRRIHWRMSLDQALRRVAAEDEDFHRRTDNHFRPMRRIVGEGAMVFRLENGGSDLIEWLDAVTGTTGGPSTLPRANESLGSYLRPPSRLRHWVKSTLQPKIPPLDRRLRERVGTLYEEDYEFFGYDPFEDEILQSSQAPKSGKSAPTTKT